MEGIGNITDRLKAMDLTVEEVDYTRRGYHYEVRMESVRVRELAETLFASGFFLEFVTAVHVTPVIQVVYQYAHFEMPIRINAKTYLNGSQYESQSVPTISDIYQGASWHERETRDFYGVLFEGNENMKTLMLDDGDRDLKPLLKSEKKLKRYDEICWNFVKS